MGFCLFQLASPTSAIKSGDLTKKLQSPDDVSSLIKLQAIHRFTSTAEAVQDASEVGEGKVSKSLKKFLTAEIKDKASKGAPEQLVVIDPKLGGAISKKVGIDVYSDSSVMDLYRGIREHLASLLSASGAADGSGSVDARDISTMALGLSHSLSRYKLKFSPDKVDTMIVQAIGLLDDLDKEVNIYAMRVKEWYGWHFPEMGKIVNDNVAYAKCIRAMGFRTDAHATDFSEILPTEVEEALKAAAEISMGTEISDSDLSHIQELSEQVINISAYRAQLYSYLQQRMSHIAPNLTALVGELVGARLISHAGSLMSLAKAPASTIQILGAEKALFRALKTKHDTPKYGLLYHASLVGQAPNKLKGKMARMVATKTALSVRLDALADDQTDETHTTNTGNETTGHASIGVEARNVLEHRLHALEGGNFSGALKRDRSFGAAKQHAYQPELSSAPRTYNTGVDAPVTAKPAPTPAAAEDGGEESQELSKEERKAAKKAAKKAAAAAKESGGGGGGDVSVATTEADESKKLSKDERKAAKKAAKKRAADDEGDDSKVEKKKKKSKHSE